MNLVKSTFAVIASVLIIFAFAISNTAAEKPIIGDVDGDGSITVQDATMIQNVLANIQLAGAPVIPLNRFSGIEPVNPLQPENVSANISLAGAPDIPLNNVAGIDPVNPLQPENVLLNI